MSETFLKCGIWRWAVVVNEDSNCIDLEDVF